MAEPTPITSSTPESPNPEPSSTPLPLTSHETALALLPPPSARPRLDRLRALYDAACPKWPPHINLLYPFVRPEQLTDAVERISAALRSEGESEGVQVALDKVGVFERAKRENTIFLSCSDDEGVARLRGRVLRALGGEEGKGRKFQMHLTMGQSEDAAAAPHKFLVEKVGRVPRVEWTAREMAVLVRERTEGGSVMRLWGTVGVDGTVRREEGALGGFYEEGDRGEDGDGAERDTLQSGLPYYFEEETERWVPFRPGDIDMEEEARSTLSVASYNVLAEFEWPASEARYPLIVKNILAENAEADVLVLQEVTDGFLAHLLGDAQIRDAYPFCSHGPPTQDDIEPLPNYLNIVVLSKLAFDWEYVSFRRKHKGAVVARFEDVGRSIDGTFLPVVVGAVHLSHGLTDGAVAAKKTDIKRITGYLAETYPDHPWILAGDFNVTTSSASIDAALKKKTISDLSATHLASLDKMFTDLSLDDAWSKAAAADGSESDDGSEEVEGEQGATWDPTANGLAAAMAAGGGNLRAQRYDRILVRGEGFLAVSKFNMFGFLTEPSAGTDVSDQFASDHWGIRCTMKLVSTEAKVDAPSDEIASLIVPVHLHKAPGALAQPGSVKSALVSLDIIPSPSEASRRERALDLLKRVLLDTNSSPTPKPALIITPVGSQSLGIWTAASDLDVLCIGPFSTSTFFSLATQRLRRAAAIHPIRILRRVRAHTGTMLELSLDGIKTDLQYAPATTIAETWPAALQTPPQDPLWSLPAQTLSKLRPARETTYLLASLPCLSAFRDAHRLLRAWARARGIYAARFGLLSGIQLTLMLARVQKMVPRGTSVEDLVATFFSHYADFPWQNHAVFDPGFHRVRLPYTRTVREPMAVLGYFPPALNTAAAASKYSARTVAEEIKRARDKILEGGLKTWGELVEQGVGEFLKGYKTFVRLEVQCWGAGAGRASQFLGWVESRCVGLLVDMQRRVPAVGGRMWPGRFVSKEEESGAKQGEEGEEGAGEFRGCYLVGLEKGEEGMGREEMQIALGALKGVLGRFEAQMRGDEKYFDSRSCWLSAEVVNRGELGELEVDRREWGEYTPGEEEDESDEEEEEEQAGSGTGSDGDDSWEKDRKKRSKKGGKQPIAAVDLRADKTKKFRTAADAMNRIRWDPGLDSTEYLVGYEDRFTGAQEKDLGAWKTEQTDEEFIPQHRILYFKRKTDGLIVWDRRTRFDKLFGNAA
ncbi:2'-5' RNA ligase superfamily-domain-containing protein [Staphylotrichum tortipilum]|uniref:polynucleotide adenylyltransferase n=1 Tax=Staphylotrichum tortipilum TaxID=2831512 RepID=A0AAN6MSH3_9PEZI|nr:2'-5' RNA ligase superfamily-domain-containing protein [Staphylotrichum longicolle]